MSALTENTVIPLHGFALPRAFPWQVRFIAAVDEQLRRLRSSGHFQPPRFFGYYFYRRTPIGISGNWQVTLDAAPPITHLPTLIDKMTHGQYSIVSETHGVDPDYMLVHDTHDGSCWLWRFNQGMRFVESTEPTQSSGIDHLLGP